ELHGAEALAPRGALLAQAHQAGDTAFVPRAPRLDAAANPRFLLRPELVELAPRDRLGGELALLPALEVRVVARVGPQQAAVELDDARGETVEEGAVVGHHHRRRLLREQRLELRDAVE